MQHYKRSMLIIVAIVSMLFTITSCVQDNTTIQGVKYEVNQSVPIFNTLDDVVEYTLKNAIDKSETSTYIDFSNYKNGEELESYVVKRHYEYLREDGVDNTFERLSCSIPDGLSHNSEQSAYDILHSVHLLIGVRDVYNELRLINEETYEPEENIDLRYFTFEQYYKGYKVHGLTLTLTTDGIDKEFYIRSSAIPTYLLEEVYSKEISVSKSDAKKIVKELGYNVTSVGDTVFATIETPIAGPNIVFTDITEEEIHLCYIIHTNRGQDILVSAVTGDTRLGAYHGPIC